MLPAEVNSLGRPDYGSMCGQVLRGSLPLPLPIPLPQGWHKLFWGFGRPQRPPAQSCQRGHLQRGSAQDLPADTSGDAIKCRPLSNTLQQRVAWSGAGMGTPHRDCGHSSLCSGTCREGMKVKLPGPCWPGAAALLSKGRGLTGGSSAPRVTVTEGKALGTRL